MQISASNYLYTGTKSSHATITQAHSESPRESIHPSNAAATREEQSRFLSARAKPPSVGFMHGKAKYLLPNKLWSAGGKRYYVLSKLSHVKKMA